MTTKQPLAGTTVDLSTNQDNGYKVIATTVTDTFGSFTFRNIRPQNYSLTCFYKMTAESMFYPSQLTDQWGRSDGDSSFTLQAGQSYNHTFYLMVACPFDKTKGLNDCPNCKKHDMVQPIFWGLPVINTNGKLAVNGKDISDYYLGGCSPDPWCNPTKHCKRCNVDF